MSVPRATLMSLAAAVARLKTWLPAPTSFRTFVKVNSRLAPDWIASSAVPVCFCREAARASTCFAVTFAAPPVVAMTFAVRADAFS